MSNVFSSEFWRSLYFRAMGGQASEAASPTGEMSALLTGSSSFRATGELLRASVTIEVLDTHDGRKRQPVYDQDTLIALARAEEEADKARREKERKSKFDLRRILGRVLGEPEPESPKPAPVVIAAPIVTPAEPVQDEAALDEAARLKAQKEDDDAIILLLLAA
jgi:hypothetical protein